MKLVFILFTFLLLLNCSQSLHEHSTFASQLTIAIHQNLPEDVELIPLLQEVITNASLLFHQVTNGYTFAETVKIIVPNFWTTNTSEVCNDIFAQSDIQLESHLLSPGFASIHTVQYDDCGQPGKYITISKHFLHKDQSFSKNKTSLKLFQQIIRYKFGIFENLNPSHENTTTIDHLQDVNCFGKSSWQVLKGALGKKHSGYKLNKTFQAPKFKILKTEPASAYIFLMDVSENLWNKSKGWSPHSVMQHIFKHFAEEYLPLPSHLAFVTYSDKASVLRNTTLIGTKTDLKHFFHDLQVEKSGAHQNLDIGLHACLKVLESKGLAELGARIVLLTDIGWDSAHSNVFENITKEVFSKGLIFNSFVVGHDTHHHHEKLQKLSKTSAGSFNLIRDQKHSLGHLPALLAALTPQEVILVTQEEMHIHRNLLPFKKEFNIDSSLRGRAQAILDRRNAHLGSGSFRLVAPNGEYAKPHRTKRLDTHRSVFEANQTGIWGMEISELEPSSNNTEDQLQLSFHVKAKRVPRMEESVQLNSWLKHHKAYNILSVYAQLTSTNKLENVSVTAEVLDHTGNVTVLALLDSGLGADVIANDGVNSGYFTQFDHKGHYQVFVRTSGIEISKKSGMVNETFNRYSYAGAFLHKWEQNVTDRIPPARIKDLHILNTRNQSNNSCCISVMWTAVGDNMEYGEVAAYELRAREFNKTDASSTFSEWHRIMEKNILNGSLLPLPSGSLQNVTFSLPQKLVKRKPKRIQIALRTHDHNNNPSEVSNVVNRQIGEVAHVSTEHDHIKPNGEVSSVQPDVLSEKLKPISVESNNNVTIQTIDNSKSFTISELLNTSKNLQTSTGTPNSTFAPNEILRTVSDKNLTVSTQTMVSNSYESLFSTNGVSGKEESTSNPENNTSVKIVPLKKIKYNMNHYPDVNMAPEMAEERTTTELENDTRLVYQVEYEQDNSSSINSSSILMAPGNFLENDVKPSEKIRFAHINLRVSTVVAAWVGGFATTFFIMVIVAAVVKNRQRKNYNIKKSEGNFMEVMALKEDSL